MIKKILKGLTNELNAVWRLATKIATDAEIH
jgi:hypothetical protein